MASRSILTLRRKFLVANVRLFLLATAAAAAELKGKVIGVADKQVRISVEGEFLPQVGDEVAISFQIPSGPLVRVGKWKVSEVSADFVTATLVEATGKPTVDQIATINAANPVRRSAPSVSSAKPDRALRPSRAKLLYQGKIYDTRHTRLVVKGRPLDYYFYETPPAGSVPAVMNGKQLENQFIRDPAVDHPDQSKVNWMEWRYNYNNGEWQGTGRDGLTVEVLERYEGAARKP